MSDLQAEVLMALAGIEPRWTLTGGGALAGFHLRHRETKDLDLFFLGLRTLDEAPRAVRNALLAAGLSVEDRQVHDSFVRLDVRRGGEATLLDLVAEPIPSVESPAELRLGGAAIQVDTPHEILVNKLCTVLSRSEPRDLVDLRALLEAGFDLDRAIRDAPKKQHGFSALDLAWVCRGLSIPAAGPLMGMSEDEIALLERFRDEFVHLLVRNATPPFDADRQ